MCHKIFQNQTLKFQCEFNYNAGGTPEGEGEEDADSEVFQFTNVMVLDSPDADTHTSIYSAETENMATVSIIIVVSSISFIVKYLVPHNLNNSFY